MTRRYDLFYIVGITLASVIMLFTGMYIGRAIAEHPDPYAQANFPCAEDELLGFAAPEVFEGTDRDPATSVGCMHIHLLENNTIVQAVQACEAQGRYVAGFSYGGTDKVVCAPFPVTETSSVRMEYVDRACAVIRMDLAEDVLEGLRDNRVNHQLYYTAAAGGSIPAWMAEAIAGSGGAWPYAAGGPTREGVLAWNGAQLRIYDERIAFVNSVREAC